MRLNVLLTTAAALLCISAVPASADFWDHNGSLMYMAETDGGLYIDYEVPRSGLAKIGVRPGTRLFQGNFRGDSGSVIGTAYVFAEGCQPAPYNVDGEFIDENTLQLAGYAPIRQGCQVVGYSVNKNSFLTFTFVASDGD